jgi:chromosomal replication initiator protein
VVTEDIQFAAELRGRLVDCLGPERFELWFGNQTRFRFDGHRLTVFAASAFTRDWLRRNFVREMRQCCRAVFESPIEVEFDVDESIAAGSAEEADCVADEARAECANGVELPPRPVAKVETAGMASAAAKPIRMEPRFAAFVVGRSNEYAFTAATMTARGSQQASPVLFCGSTGVGKTHLLRSLRAEYRRHHPRARAVYLTAEQFTTSFVEALRGTGLPSFRTKCRGADLLLVDDLHFFAGKRASIDELLHTLDAMHHEGRQVALASARTLAELRPLGKELLSRLSGGLVCELELPDFATRLEIVRRLALEMGLTLTDEVASLVATQISSGASELRGALHRLQAVATARHKPITPQQATTELAELSQQCSRHVGLPEVEQAVCDVFGIEPSQLRSERKGRTINEPRMLAMWLARKYTRAPWSEIGQFFGRRSHSTVIAANRRVEQLIRKQAKIGLSRETCGVEEAIRRVEAVMRTA